MFCKKCGAKLDGSTKFCTACGSPVEGTTQATQAVSTAKENDNTKLWKILAYIGPLFLVGMFVKEKDDKSVKFHVGQGILVCIYGLAVGLINSLVVANIFRKEVEVWGIGTGVYEVSGLGILIQTVLGLTVLVLSVLGIVNVCKGEDKELPIIGKYSFYK